MFSYRDCLLLLLVTGQHSCLRMLYVLANGNRNWHKFAFALAGAVQALRYHMLTMSTRVEAAGDISGALLRFFTASY
jgi:protein involved in ribonucleotide reduction